MRINGSALQVKNPGVLGIAALVLLACAAPAGEPGPGYRRWAILAAPEVRQTGLSDLLTADLSKTKGIELVEREQLQSVTEEQARQLLGDAVAQERLKLGKILRADGLVLLSIKRADQYVLLQVALSDCVYGARLAVESLAYDPGRSAELVKSITAIVTSTRQRLAGGIKFMVAVPHFLSQDFDHRYDYLQVTYAGLLENALRNATGVVVIETEEAHSIRRELEVSGSEIGPRIVPLWIEGSYRTTRTPEGPAQVVLSIRLSNGQRVLREAKPSPMAIDAAGAYLGQQLPEEVLQSADLRPAALLSAEQQLSALARRADDFAELGNWATSTALREAALLLDPRSAEQRTRLFREYYGILKSVSGRVPLGPEGKAVRQVIINERAEIWRLSLGHLEYLIRNRLITFDDGLMMAQQAANTVRSPLSWTFREREGCTTEFDYKAEVMNFVRQVMPLGAQLPTVVTDERKRRYALRRWWEVAVQFGVGCAIDWDPLEGDCHQHFDFLYEVLAEIIPADVPVVSLALKMRLRDGQWQHARKDACYAAYRDFCNKLAESPRLSAAYQPPGISAPGTSPRVRLFPTDQPQAERHTLIVRRGPHSYRNASAPPVQSATSPADFGRLHFEPLTVNVKQLDGQVSPLEGHLWATPMGMGTLRNWTACGKGLDVAWNGGAVLFMREPGLLEEVFIDSQAGINDRIAFSDVQWDGQHIWIATRLQGIWIVEPSGRVAVRVTEREGLPPADRELLLHVLEPGHVAAVGSLGKDLRAWCAVVSYKGGRPDVNVFHHATHVRPPDRAGEKEEQGDPETAFAPIWMHAYQLPPPNQTARLLIGRRGKSTPLLVNLRTLAVACYQDDPPPTAIFLHRSWTAQAFYSHNDKLLIAGADGLTLCEWDGDGTRLRRTKVLAPYYNGYAVDEKGTLVPYDGWLYTPGDTWFRVHATTFELESLVDHLPPDYAGFHASASSHYGIIAWQGRIKTVRGRVFRVRVSDATLPSWDAKRAEPAPEPRH